MSRSLRPEIPPYPAPPHRDASWPSTREEFIDVIKDWISANEEQGRNPWDEPTHVVVPGAMKELLSSWAVYELPSCQDEESPLADDGRLKAGTLFCNLIVVDGPEFRLEKRG